MLFQTKGNVPEAFTRGELLASYYVLMRYIDDIVDKDAALPSTASSREEYVEQRLAFAQNPARPTDTADYLTLHCYSSAAKLGFSIADETRSILLSMLFDAKRVEAAERTGQGLIFPEQELRRNFYLCDIEGTVKGMLKLFGDDPQKFPLLEPIGLADRTRLTLEDLSADIRVGLINIPEEDMAQYGISRSDLEAVAALPHELALEKLVAIPEALPKGVREWVENKAKTGLALVAENKEIVRTHQFRLLGKLALQVKYALPMERYFQRVLMAYNSPTASSA